MTNTGFGRRGVQPAAADAGNELPFRFNGSGKEYFGIWIVNILLSIMTLGIYSAWAKVRNKRYFNGHTELDGHRFDYHASPMSILKGRIVVVVVLVVLNLLAQLHPALSLVVVAIYAVALPWVIIRGLRFNANMTSYRNLRFHFEGTKWNAFKTYILWPIAGLLTLGGLFPFSSRANARFLGGGHSYGQSHFTADPPLKPYYRGLGVSLLILIAALVVAGIVTFLSFMGADGFSDTGETLAVLLSFAVAIPVYLAFIVAFIAYAAISRNVGFDALALEDGHQFRSTLTVGRYSWILITNFLLTIITIGLYIPWAKVRVARYLADNTFMVANGDLDRFVEGQIDDRGVASGEFLDIEGIDFGFERGTVK
ncbi:MAG: YjgN family protein [Rhizobiaceae bacterium]